MKLVTPSGYLVIIALFFFSFCEFNCSGTKLLDLRGIDMVTGKEAQAKKSITNDTEIGVDEAIGAEVSTEKDVDPVLWAGISFAAAIIGLTAFLIIAAAGKMGGGKLFHIITAAVGAISQFAIKIHIDNQLDAQENLRLLNAEYQPAYWTVLILFIVIVVVNMLPNFQVVKQSAPTNDHYANGEPDFQKLGNIE